MSDGAASSYKTFGELLKHLRRRARLTQKELGIEVGYSEAHVSRLENGQRQPELTTVRTLLIEALGLSKEAELAARLIELAEAVRGKQPTVPTAQNDPVQPISDDTDHGGPGLSHLPVQLTRFIGREREMAEVTRLLGTTRLLTLTGSGGAGKTRLAIEVGATLAVAQSAPTFPDGVWMVEFASLSDGRLVSDLVAAAFGLQAMSRTSEVVLIEHLHDKHLLLILDNCEHLIADCAVLAVKLLQTCPRLYLLVTSREALNVPGEVTWGVPSLAHDEAMTLFVERARSVQPDFVLDENNTVFVERICERLDAMPLALELAAARLRSFSAEQIAARLDDAFRVLTGGSRTALPRQQTLRATIDWSYALLPEAERTMLCELSVFAGGWTLEAAEAIHGSDALDLLDQLVSKSLVNIVHTPTGPRYSMVEMIWQYASEKLSQSGNDAIAQVRAKHMDFYHQLQQDIERQLNNRVEGRIGRARAVRETPNLLTALKRSIATNQWLTGFHLLTCLLENVNEPGYIDMLIGFADKMILSNPNVGDHIRCRCYLLINWGFAAKGDMVGSIVWSERASDLARHIEDDDLVYEAELNLSFTRPDYAETIAALERILDDVHGTGISSAEVRAYSIMGYRMTLEGCYHQAIETLHKADILCEGKLHNMRDGVQWRLGQVYLAQHDYANARSALELSLAVTRQSGRRTASMMVDLGTAGIYTGDLDIARQALTECFDWEYRHDNMERLAQGLVLGAGLAHVLGKLDKAAQLLGAATAIHKVHHTHGIAERELFLEYDRRLPAVRASMEPAAFERTWEAGQAVTLKEAMAMALAL